MEPFYIVDGNVNWYNHYGKQHGSSFKKLKIELPYDPAIPLLGIYPEGTKTLIQKDIRKGFTGGSVVKTLFPLFPHLFPMK